MLNVRLYRTSWLVAGVALIVALLTLQTPDAGPQPLLPSTFDGQDIFQLANQLEAIAPQRPAGSAADLQAARFVQGQLSQVPGAAAPGSRKSRVQVQDFQARRDGEPVDLQNVYLVVPGVADGNVPGGVVVVAPRDTPAGVSAGASSTAVMLRLAQASGTTRHQRPHLFVSTDGSTIGNAGLRWFLERFSAFPLSAVIVLDAPGEENGDRIQVWTAGRTDKQSLGLGNIAAGSVERVGGRADWAPSLTGQLLRLGLPQTFGDQGAAIAAGLPAVALSNRPETPAPRARPHPRAPRARGQRGERPPGRPRRRAERARGRRQPALRGQVPAADDRPPRLLLVMLPVLVLALDIVARQRRAHVPLRGGLRRTAIRAVPLLAALAAAHLLSLGGLLPQPAAGVPPIPADARFGAVAGLAIILTGATAWLAWRATRRAAARTGASPRAEGTVALRALAVLLVLLWILSPYAVVLAARPPTPPSWRSAPGAPGTCPRSPRWRCSPCCWPTCTCGSCTPTRSSRSGTWPTPRPTARAGRPGSSWRS